MPNLSEDKGWYGVDLDGTLAEYHGWVGYNDIGKPIPVMMQRVNYWLSIGRNVKIFTARANSPEGKKAVEDWTKQHFERQLEVTATKDFGMIELWDDRCVQVESNTGHRVDRKDRVAWQKAEQKTS